MEKTLTIKECISLLKEHRERYILSGYKQKKREIKNLLKIIKDPVCGLREGEEVYNRISGHLTGHCDYDEAIEVLEKADRFSGNWPWSLITRVELTGADIFSAVLMLLVGIGSVITGFMESGYALESVNWPHTRGVITESYVKEHRDDDTSSVKYRPVIEYEYTVKGKTYTNDTINYDNDYRGRSWAGRAVKKYPVEHYVKVFYKPGRPGVSVLEPGIYRSTYYPVYIGYGMIIFSLVFTLFRSAWSVFRGS